MAETAFIPNYLGYFQFDNLVNNRVPFALLSLLPNTDSILYSWYSGVAKLHLENHLINCTVENFEAQIAGKSLPPHTAYVVLGVSEVDELPIAEKLDALGKLNVFIVRGGIKGLTEERVSEA